ncbi:hypothetical protein [Sphingomonas sp. CROZ-RG-20F-R02-07]|uniref:hypothetical protein n=1 Tax=Sphingomonas sp. CROZ-RG-20F-R02-07 TaxID=2914832 RepID=UPI001F58D391|nr:hypothetical protein [Sphingomonas sp. CROZ-RG-20F-R02-07]
MSFFTDAEQEHLRVARMIIHVVGRPDEEFTPEPEIEVQEEGFFRARIIAEAGDAVHEFKADSFVRPVIERMALGESTFQDGGQDLARLFARDHVRTAISGAFFVFELNVGGDARVYALIKYDYREAVEFSQAEGRSVLRAIVQAFVKERKAVQKICLVRVVDGVADVMVSAADRMQQAPDLTDYFAKYLGVARNRSDTELSDRLNEAMRESLNEVRQHLPNGVPAALRRMKEALQGRDPVTNDDVVNAALHAAGRPEDETIRATIEAKTRRCLRRQRLDDVAFTPERRIFDLRPREYVRTAEEVRLEYPAEQLGQAITRVEHDGNIVFTITTRRIVEDGTVADRSRARG